MTHIQDTHLHQGLRRQLVKQLSDKGVTDSRILEAIGSVPRHLFLDSAFVVAAYQDVAFPIGEGQTISQPSTVAFQTQLLSVEKHHKVLEIGTGSGYQASVLAKLQVRVFTIERQRNLYDSTRKRLDSLGFKGIKTFFGDGTLGLASYAPFDRILVTAGAPVVPEALTQQLKPGGILVIPVGDETSQKMLRITKREDESLVTEQFADFRFVPLIGKQGW